MNHYKDNRSVYIVAHRDNLIDQLSKEVKQAGIDHGIVGQGFPLTRKRVQVCSILTLVNKINILPEPSLIIIDEAHHAKSASYLKTVNHWATSLILGMTATPQRLDGRPMNDIFDTLICGPSNKELIEQGYLSDFEYFAPEIIAAPQGKSYGDYNISEVSAIMDKGKIIGNVIDNYKKYADGLPTIVSCASIAHAEHVAERFRACGYKARAVHSKMNKEEIKAITEALKMGTINIVTHYDLIGEGFDAPGVCALIQLRHTQSLTIFLQHCGRALRKKEGKKHAIIIDHVGNFLRHGLPDNDRAWTLEGRKKKAVESSTIKRCPGCTKIVHITQRVCPYCKFQWTLNECVIHRELPKEEAGKLVKIKEKRNITLSWQELVKEIDQKAYTQKQAIAISKKYGYRHTAGWTIWKNILKH